MELKEGEYMEWIIAIIVGGVVGWLASMIMGTNRRQGLLLDIVFGIIGAFLAKWFFGGVLGIASALGAGSLSIAGIFWAIVGAVILIAIVEAVRSAYRGGMEHKPGAAYHEEYRERKDDNDRDRRIR